MSFDDSVLNDLGIKDNSGEKDDGFEKFLSKPIQRQYQPFGGPRQQTQSSIAEPQYAPPEPQPQPQPQPYQNFNDYDLDAYEQIKKKHSQISQYTRENKKSASHYGGLYDDFKKNEFTPYFESLGGFGDFETDEEYIGAIDEMYKSDLKNSQQEDGFFGASDAKLASQENLKKYASWNQPNGMRDKFLRLKAERDRRKTTAEEAEAMEYALFEQMTSIPISQREALDASLKARTAKPRSKKATDEMLNQMQFEKPVVDMVTGEVINLEKTDPRTSPPSAVNMVTGQRTPAAGKQANRLEAAMRGDIAGFTSRRQAVAKDRQLRDKGFMFSNGGQIDGRPIGMSRKDSDLLDLEEMKKAGMTEYKGQPIEQAIESLGGEERLKVAKVMQSVYAAKSNYEDIQLEYLKNSGGAKGDALREKMEAAREEVNKTIGLASQFGLDNELFEQAETTGWLSAIGNAVKRGLLMSEMSNYTPDFLTNTLDADEMQRFIEIASEIEELPTSSTMKRVKSTKSDGFLDAMGNLLFDNPAAIPEMFVESLSSFLPSAIKWMLPTAATGALAGSIIPGAGTASGAVLGARASWGAASFVLEASGMALEGMQELGIDWKNPKIFAAAWTNESIRNKIQKKMVQKGTPIAVADMLTGMMAGKVMAIANHTGNAMFKGGKLLNKTQFNKTAGAVPRFTKFQKTRNAAAELGADSLMGMSGEYLGQWASKEPGEDWDWDAIAAEGIVGVGPGVLSSALEMRSRSGNYFGNAPIEITGENMTETGSMGTVTRAGYSAPYQTFNDAESMMGHLQTVEGVSPESLEFTQNWVERMYAVNPEGMSKLKIAFSPRTPDANLKNRGTFEARDGHNIMYINEKEFAADPMGAFMHESGHFARIMILSDEELRTMWGGLGEDNQLEAYTQYFTKKPDATFDSLDEKTQKKIRRAFDRTPDDVLAEEWFSYQFARVLLDNTGDKIIKKEIKAFNDKVLRPIIGEYVGTENLAGAKKGEKDYILDQKILQALGYENGMPDPKVPDEGGKPGSSTPQTKEQTQTKLNAMPGTPQEKSKIAKAVNAMLGADILTESPSAYSPLQNLNTKLAQEEAPEDPEKVADAAPAFTGEKEKETTVKIEGERPKAPAEKVPDVVENRSLNNKIGAIQRKLGKLQRQGNEGSPEKIKNRNKAIARYKKDLESLIKQGVKRGEKLVKPEDTIKKVEKRAAEKKAEEKVDLKVKIEEKEKKTFKRGEIKKENPRKANTPETIAKEETEARNKGLTKDRIDREVAYRKFVNSLLPNNKRKRDVELYKTLQANKELVSNQYKLDKRIVEIQKSLGPNASASRIISELLNLSSIARLAPESIAAKIRKAVEPDASSSKPPSSKDVEDTAAEITDRLEVIKDLLRTELDRIDKDIASLETGLAPQPAAGWQKSTAPAPAKVFAGIGSRALPPSAQKEVAKLFNQKGQSKPSKVHSGSAKGSDYLFEMLAVKAGIAVEAHTFEGHRGTAGDPANFKKHSQEELNKADSALKKANETLGRTFPAKDQHTNNLLRRNYYQVVDSDQIIAFAPLLNGLVQGGTGWAVQMAIDMGKEVHIFDTNTAQWFSWPQPAAQGQGPKKKAESPGFIEVDGEKVLTPKIEDEIAEMRRARKLVEVAIDMIAPEEATIEWKDVPHSQYWYKPKFQKGPIRRLTLGMLAENRDFNKITILDRYKKDTVGEDTRAPQEILWDWVTTDFDPNKGSETTGTKNAYYGLVTEYDIKTKKHTERPRTKSEYIMILEAVKASAMFTKKNNIGKKPMGTVRLKKNKKTGRMEEYGRGYPGGGYTTDRGATYAAVIAERIRSLMNTSAKDEKGKPVKDEKGMLVPVMERAPIVSTNPTLEDMIALKAANGRTLELLGDPSDSLAQFHAALFQIARDETLTERQTQIATLEEIKRIRKEFLTEEDRKKIRKPKRTFQSIASEVSDNQFEYAEDEGNPFPSVEGSKSLLASLIKIPSLSARQKFEKGYYDQIYRNLEKIDLGIELRIGYDIDVTTENAKKIEDYVNNNKLLDKAAKDEILGYKNELYISGVELEKLRSNQIELTRDLEYFIAEPQEFDSKYDQAQQSDHILKKRRDDFIKKYFKNLNRFDYGNIQEYEYLEPFIESDNPTIEKRDGKYAHDEFDASEIHTPFDVIQAFSRGRERFDTPTNRAMLTETEKTELEKEAAEVLRKMSASEFTKKYGERFKGLKREDVLRALNDPSDLGSRYSSRVVESPDASGSTLLKENELVLNQDSVKRQQSGQLFEELQTELFKENIKKGGGLQDSIFRKNRTTIQKDEMVLAKENIMENADPSSSTNVTAVDIAEFFLAGSNPVKQMKKLELLPSSEVKGETLEGLNKLKQLPGGLGEGLLVYIFPKFLESMYSRLGIKDWSPTTPKSKEPFSWQLEKGDLLFNGKPVQDFNMFIDEESRMSPEEMAVLVEPIVQAVIDARGLDIKNEYDKRQDALLQRNTLEGAETADERTDTSEMRDDSGNEEAKQVATLEIVEDEAKRQQTQADAAKQLSERPELLKKADDSLIDELLNTENISRELRDILTDEYARRNNIKKFDNTFTPKNRTLNADAGKPETGKPITLKGFHGSNQAKTVYEEGFDPGKLGSFTGAASAREGFFFARRPKTARRYSGTFGPVGRLFSKLVEVFERKTPAVSPIKDTYYSYRKAFNSSEQKEGLSMIEEKLFSSGLVNQEGKWNDRSEQKIVDKFLKSLDTIKTPKGLAGKAVEVLKDEFKETQKPVADNRGLIQASLAFENPYVVDFKGKNRTYADYVKAIQKAKKDGRDGAILKNTFDPMADDIYVVFNASQISMDKLKDRTLNSDATLTSDVNPNLAKANLLSRIAGDSELKKNFEEWLKDKKDSELAGSFMMSFVDQADPLKKVHRSLFETLKAAGMDITKGPMRSLYNMLNVHGKWHQYFGKGYDTVEQARIKFIQPIKDAMLKYGIDQGTFGNYLLARAAPSRNQHLRDKVKRLQKEAEGLTGTERQTALNDIEKIYLNKDGSVKHSGISDQAAYDQITEIEKDQNFVNFANEALDPYYNMNKESISMLRNASMIRESVELDGVQQGISEYDRMVGAMSKIDLADANSDFNFAGSKIKLSDPKYSYSPMQGFEGETEAFFDAERAWEELGKGQNSSGKGWDQPKSTFLNDGAFGRYNGTKGPNPDSVLANAINQFFDSAIRSHKNEVSQSFGEMFELMKSIAYPNREDSIESSDPELRIARGMLSKLPEEQKKKIKEEFDEIFEIDFQKTAEKNMYTLEAINDGLDNEIVAKRKKLNAEFKQDPLVFVYRRDGAPKFIKFKDTTKGTRMARSMKNLRYESLPSVLKYFNKITRFMAQMFTSMNPAFIIPNFFRDLGTAFIHLTEDDKKKLVKDVFKFKNLKWVTSIGKAELLISQGKDPMKELNITPTKKVKGQTEAQYAQAILKRGNKIEMYAYAKRNGAKIGYVRHDTVPELIRNIKKETGKSEGATKRRLKYALSYVDAANTGVENSVRMSTFWAAIKNGYTPQESATMSRNITVDFNQKGELTQAFGSLYVFFGAAVNSTHRFMTTLNRRSPAEQKLLIGGIATASFLVATFNRLLDDDEEEAVPDYDTISSYKRDTNLIMPIPAGLPGFFNDKKDTGYFSMPLPLGYNLFWSMGQVVADTFANNYGGIRGGSGVMEGANRLLESSMNAFNPVGGASIATIGTPTFVTPIIELWANKNFMGREIRYKDDQFGVPEPGHMQDPKSTPEHWNALSKGLNEFFGGNDVIKGSLSGGFGSKNPLMYDQDSDIKFDISGNQFKHVFYGYLGGPGQLLDTAFGGLFSAVNGTASIDNVGQVPIINRFVRGTTYGSHTRELYYNLRDTVKTAEKAVKDAKKISPKAYSLVNNDLRPLLSINSQLKAFEAQKNKFSRLKSKVESASNLTDAQKTQRIADIEEKELNMMVKVIKKAQSLGIS
jgi:hypothetical protein